ncbi:Lipocalin-like domain protein [compost metagenome]
MLDHADDYSWSIVGEPSGRYLWILSREARPGAETVQALRNRVQPLGYDLSLLRETQQPG